MAEFENPLLTVLEHGEITVKGKFLWGSNYTFLTEVRHEGQAIQAVYKPTRGERPLWDFPSASLAHREVAAYIISEALGIGMVPETVYRRRAPVGPGSLQRYVEHDPDCHYFNLSEEDHQRLRPVVLFDVLINNADRKGGHVLIGLDNKIWLIDHGICFHVEDKLRTVIWDFAGETIPEELLATLAGLRDRLSPNSALAALLLRHLSSGEVRTLAGRADDLLAFKVFPNPNPDRRPIPWPPL